LSRINYSFVWSVNEENRDLSSDRIRSRHLSFAFATLAALTAKAGHTRLSVLTAGVIGKPGLAVTGEGLTAESTLAEAGGRTLFVTRALKADPSAFSAGTIRFAVETVVFVDGLPTTVGTAVAFSPIVTSVVSAVVTSVVSAIRTTAASAAGTFQGASTHPIADTITALGLSALAGITLQVRLAYRVRAGAVFTKTHLSTGAPTTSGIRAV
jgi:hypothetical protein